MVPQDQHQAARNEITRISLQKLQSILKERHGRHYTAREAAEIGRGLVRIFALFAEIEKKGHESNIRSKMKETPRGSSNTNGDHAK